MQRMDGLSVSFTSKSCSAQVPDATLDTSVADETTKLEKTTRPPNKHGYISQSAMALRCRVIPPPCIENPYLKDALVEDIDLFGSRGSKYAVPLITLPPSIPNGLDFEKDNLICPKSIT